MRGTVPGVVVGGLTSLVCVVVIGRVWADCGIGANAAADSMTLLLLAPLLWIAAAVPWVVLLGTLGRRHPGPALTAGVVCTVWFTWFVVTWIGMVDSYPAPSCPGNVPPWWPAFIPT
ncbi:hypothetical protein ABZ464_38985 [Streptomyces sp. NPDC005820]|uniref:hypothetical protein n=1 Tax=Streptomyces sp. NPDC005820 TaxID=3157069 RepID=UPI0033C9BD1E